MRILPALAIFLWSTAATAKPDAFSQPLPFLSDHERATVHLGNSLFRKSWRAAPSETSASDGLGPIYNARSCADCHFRDGRGRPPKPGGNSLSLILQLAPPDPIYGSQLQTNAIDGHKPEGRVSLTYEEHTFPVTAGKAIKLRKPVYRIVDPAYGPLAAQTKIDPRIAPPIFGLGLLEAIDPDDIRAGADPNDRNGDGISGRVAEKDGVFGRFGWKAAAPSIAAQNAKALSLDIGIANRLRPALWGDCTIGQQKCRIGPHGDSERHGGLEVSDKVFKHLTFYIQGIAPPKPRNVENPKVQMGKRLFAGIGCVDCHRPEWRTGSSHPVAALRNRKIYPYSDLLLHNMGEELAGATEGTASAKEWRTAPLWGIGLTEAVAGYAHFMHDGRARTLEEAILWHGGEAQAARDRFTGLTKVEMDALIAFLISL